MILTYCTVQYKDVIPPFKYFQGLDNKWKTKSIFSWTGDTVVLLTAWQLENIDNFYQYLCLLNKL